ncbi:DUF2971 domain-containing protein [Microbulbifer sp. GL-2]|uniref:DUF2971 domain-containing protein n=1 Tax=Microbulbifer sp. GL-2 TaxID=2591606 RepID=UPI0011628949|nr:DUF2971 domain-containing protein [Microbulbifer sp. GL-2]BBM03963.1 hypothetical protein GL2_40370 [Microbulbifer sp. GL-2]
MHEIKKLLWDDLNDGLNYPEKRPLLAHYTSIDTLEKILKKNELWLSNPLYMNDYTELSFGMGQGYRLFTQSKELHQAFEVQSQYDHLLASFQRLFIRYTEDHVFNTYLTCFSEHCVDDNDGRLSMWRGYGDSGKGAALVIDSAKINFHESSPLIVSRVEYQTTHDRINWLEKKISAIADWIKNRVEPLSNNELEKIAYIWLERLKIFSLLTKHSGFNEEREWRIIYMSDRDPEEKLSKMLSYIINGNGIEPKLKLNPEPLYEVIGDNRLIANLTDRIIIGPSISTKFTAKSICRMLQHLNHDQLVEKVKPSTIPYRQ